MPNNCNELEIESQRPGRDKSTAINHTYINSGEYRRKFDKITDNPELNQLLYQLAKKMLVHRSGTKLEDMYWVDLDSIKVIAKEINGQTEKQIDYSQATEDAIAKYDQLLTLHSHPDSFPPSIDDLNSNYTHGYVSSLIICHNGKIYMYNAERFLSKLYYDLVVEDYSKEGYNDCEAQIQALLEIQENFDISFKEVTDDGCI